jgi:hypothetical protein
VKRELLQAQEELLLQEQHLILNTAPQVPVSSCTLASAKKVNSIKLRKKRKKIIF